MDTSLDCSATSNFRGGTRYSRYVSYSLELFEYGSRSDSKIGRYMVGLMVLSATSDYGCGAMYSERPFSTTSYNEYSNCRLDTLDRHLS